MPLSDSELWERVRGLEGKTVYTIQQRKRNKILCVTDNAVMIENRKSKLSRLEIRSLYEQVYEKGEVFSGDTPKFTYAVTYAILVEAVLDEIEAIPGKCLGIRLRRHLT